MLTPGEIVVQAELHPSGRWITVPLTVPGVDPIMAVLDTGAPVSGISPRVHGLLSAANVLRPSSSVNRYVLGGVLLGGHAVRDLELAVIRRLDRLDVDGLLGLDFLTRFGHIHFHTRSMQLVLEPRALDAFHGGGTMQVLTHGSNPARGQAASMRVNALVQIAHGMSLDRSNPERPFGDFHAVLGSTKDGIFQPRLSFANGDYDLANAVARGELDLATVNPSAYVTMAYRGTGPYAEALPLRTIAVMPTLDYMLFAVSPASGLTSIPDIRDKKYPLKLSIRGSQAHGTRFIIDQVFKANGFSLKDVESWGGQFFYCESPNNPERFEQMRTGAIDAVFDEGVKGWGYVAIECGMQFLDLDPTSRKALETVGWGLCPGKAIFEFFPDDFMAASFSGWPIFTRADVADDVAYQMAKALHSSWDRLVFDLQEGETATLADVCTGTDAAPNDIPLHPGAARYYREQGIQV